MLDEEEDSFEHASSALIDLLPQTRGPGYLQMMMMMMMMRMMMMRMMMMMMRMMMMMMMMMRMRIRIRMRMRIRRMTTRRKLYKLAQTG